ncbi:MAG: hypothetical protein IJT94_01705 [Oscillibacter sp.]|nr:hypothetical protein [Oscillibacter sp.]
MDSDKNFGEQQKFSRPALSGLCSQHKKATRYGAFFLVEAQHLVVYVIIKRFPAAVKIKSPHSSRRAFPAALSRRAEEGDVKKAGNLKKRRRFVRRGTLFARDAAAIDTEQFRNPV